MVTLAKEVLLDSARRPLCARVAARVRAAQDGVDRLWYVDGDDPRLRSLVTATSGCRAGPAGARAGPARTPAWSRPSSCSAGRWA